MLEERIEELKNVMKSLSEEVHALTKAIGGMQASAPVLDPNAGAPFEQLAPVEKTLIPNEKLPTTTGTSQTSAEELKPALTYVDNVKPITLRLSKEKGRETAIAVLGRFGVKGAQDLMSSQWLEYIAHCESVLNGGEV